MELLFFPLSKPALKQDQALSVPEIQHTAQQMLLVLAVLQITLVYHHSNKSPINTRAINSLKIKT